MSHLRRVAAHEVGPVVGQDPDLDAALAGGARRGDPTASPITSPRWTVLISRPSRSMQRRSASIRRLARASRAASQREWIFSTMSRVRSGISPV